MNKFYNEIAELPVYVLAILFAHELHQFQSPHEIQGVLKTYGIECDVIKITHANRLLFRLKLIVPFTNNGVTYELTQTGKRVIDHIREKTRVRPWYSAKVSV